MPEVLRVALSGANGRMGRVVAPGLEAAAGIALVARIEVGDDLVAAARAAKAHVVVDFTTPAAAASNARKILEAGCQGVIGTTGFSEADLLDLDARAKAAKRGLLVAPNFALGALLLQRFAGEAARFFPRSEIVEYHHDGKADAPSGTALKTAEVVGAAGSGGGPAGSDASRGCERHGVRIHAVRLPGLVAHQEVLFGGVGELLTLRHDALSRECYVAGIVAAVRAMPGRVGLVRGLESILFPAGPAAR